MMGPDLGSYLFGMIIGFLLGVAVTLLHRGGRRGER